MRAKAVRVMFAFFLLLQTQSAYGESLTGPAFGDISHIEEMPEEWVERGVIYEEEDAGFDLVVTLDQHLYPAIKEEVEKFATRNGIKVSVKEGTCGISAGKLLKKSADMAGFCCPPGNADRLPGLMFHTIGITPILILINHANTVDGVSFREAQRLFQGEIYRWSEIRDSKGVQGPDIAVKPIGRLHCKLRPGHWRLLLDNEDLFSHSMQEVGTIPDMISLVSKTSGAVGYEVMMMVDKYGMTGKVKALRINGIVPNEVNLLTGNYPLYRVLNITTWESGKAKNKYADKLLDYLLLRVPEVGKKYGIVPVQSLRKTGWRFKDGELTGAP